MKLSVFSIVPIATVGVGIITLSKRLAPTSANANTLQSEPANALRQQVYRRGAIAAEDDQRALEDLSNDMSMSIQGVEYVAGGDAGAGAEVSANDFNGYYSTPNDGSAPFSKASKSTSSPTADPLASKSSKSVEDIKKSKSSKTSSPTEDSLGTASPTDPLASKSSKGADAIKKSKSSKTSSPTEDSLETASPTDPLASKSSKGADAIKKSKSSKTSSPTEDSLGTASPTDPLASKSSKSTSSPTDTLGRRGRRTLGRRVAKYL